MDEQDTKMVVDYYRQKAAELEYNVVELQLQVMKLQQQVAELSGDADAPTDSPVE